MSQVLQLRRETAAWLAANNPVLALAEPGYESDTGRVKVGDGVTAWNGLPYAITGVRTRLVSGQWAPVPTLCRLRVTGAGSVSIDARNGAGVITTAVYAAAFAGPGTVIDFPFFGDDAVEVRATIAGLTAVEVLQ